MKKRIFIGLFLGLLALPVLAVEDAPMAFIDAQIAAHSKASGVYVLDKGADALVARAWLADHAQRSIEVQYFIWSTDNIGILASESLLRAADRGVKVRVIVDDLLVDAPDESLLALAKHPNIDIRIYNPQHSVGTPLLKRLWNIVTNFRGANQRMHDKTFIVDGKVAITGGRNMAAEYFDYNHAYNFRDRDALLMGDAVKTMRSSFENFWRSPLSQRVEDLYDGIGLMQKSVRVDDGKVRQVYRELHAYAASADNFAPQVHAAIDHAPSLFPEISRQILWGDVTFVSDLPGKNRNRLRLGGGGRTTSALANLVEGARRSVVIQSPYLVMSDEARELFRRAIKRGVQVRINTNSLASTDNMQAFSGYRSQRETLLEMGVKIFEYKPDPAIQRDMMQGSLLPKNQLPVFAIHAKSMVVDGETVFIGTFNFDPRSENLNTEVGVIFRHPVLAKAVEASIETDMQAANSWNAATDDPDQYVAWRKRAKVRLWQMLPIRPLL